MASGNNDKKKIYFTAGPAKIPAEVMQEAYDEFLNYNNMNVSILEISHRSATFSQIIQETEANLRTLMQIPNNYHVLFMHGGAGTQFDSVVMNLCPELGKHSAEYLVTGYWSKAAAKSAEKYCSKVVERVFDRVPRVDELSASDNETSSSFRYYCDNETIQGLEYDYVPDTGDARVPLVCDMTSNFLSRPIDVSKFGVIFAGAQKNVGTSGLCIVVVRKDLTGKHMRITPNLQSYKTMADSKSVSNTPLTFPIYLANLCIKWMLKQGGLKAMHEWCKQKSSFVYDAIDNSNGFYTCPVALRADRSRMNIVFLTKSDELMTKFLAAAKEEGLNELKGHRSVGGLRASLYHGITTNDVRRLVDFMEAFKKANEC